MASRSCDEINGAEKTQHQGGESALKLARDHALGSCSLKDMQNLNQRSDTNNDAVSTDAAMKPQTDGEIKHWRQSDYDSLVSAIPTDQERLEEIGAGIGFLKLDQAGVDKLVNETDQLYLYLRDHQGKLPSMAVMERDYPLHARLFHAKSNGEIPADDWNSGIELLRQYKTADENRRLREGAPQYADAH